MTEPPLKSLGMLTVLKIAAALVGLAMFGAGIRMDSSTVRWVGIACVGVAWLLRFASKRPASDDQPPEETR